MVNLQEKLFIIQNICTNIHIENKLQYPADTLEIEREKWPVHTKDNEVF